MKQKLIEMCPSWVVLLAKALRGLTRGKWPLALATTALAKSANVDTLTGKIRFKMAYDRNPNLSVYADKVQVREFVSAKVGEDYLSKCFVVFDHPDELRQIELPRNFALKSNHGSGAMILVWEGASTSNPLPQHVRKPDWRQYLIHPDSWDISSAVNLCRTWHSQNYYFRVGQYPEFGYKNIVPKFLIEEIMTNEDGSLPEDYKFFVVHGVCKFIQVDTSRFSGHKRDLFTPDWNHLDVTNVYPMSGAGIRKPARLEEMISVAQALGSETDFIRVDLYDTSKGIKFGEMTNYPGGGVESYDPSNFDMILGQDWHPNYS